MASRNTYAVPMLPYLGAFGTFFAWNALLGGVSPVAHGASFIRIAVPLLVLCFWRYLTPLAAHRWVPWACACVGSVSTAVLFCPSFGIELPQELLVACELIGHLGVYTAQFILWSELFAGVPIQVAGVGFGLAYMFGPALYGALSLLPPQFLPGIAVCIPLALAPCFLLGLGCRPASEESNKTVISKRDLALLVPWRLILVMACFSFACGINRTFSTTEVDLASAFAAGLLITLATLVFSRRISVFTIYKAVFLAMVAALVAGMVLGGGSMASQVLLNVSQASTSVLLILYLCDRSFRYGIPAMFLVAVGRLCTLFALSVGGYAASVLSDVLGGAEPAMSWRCTG